jgi:regulation of enolase protein 1 (concanavalin A-like superfamily)
MTSLLAWGKRLFVRHQRGARTAKPHRFCKPAAEVLEDRSLLSQTVTFTTSDPGVSAAIPYWGLDTNWPSADNMRRGLIFMGSQNVNVVRMPATLDAPLVNGDITDADKAQLQQSIDLAAMAGPNALWDLSGHAPVDPWYWSGSNRVYPDRWAAAMAACQQYYNRPIWMAEPFNEPDYLPWTEGSRQDLSDIMGLLGASPNFTGTLLAGGSTISTDDAASWYDALGGRAAVGTTHALYGSVANYVSFIQHVAASGGVPFNPEVHNLAEVIIGANYGLQGAIWWGTAARARGDFVNASQGQQLGYAADWPNWSAAAVYRAPDGTVQAFLGSGERIGQPTTYPFHCTDRDVYFDGVGPTRDYTVTIGAGEERVINISWGADVQPVIGGRYAIVNANSGLAMEVQNGGTYNGAILQQNGFSGASNQLWDVSPVYGQSLDVSYFSMQNVNSAKYANLFAYSYADGSTIGQWTGPGDALEQWYFQYAGNGDFYIRSRWSNKCVSVSGGAGGHVVQQTWAGTPDQLWQLVPAGSRLLPSGWADSDAGSPGLPGSADHSVISGIWSVAGGGSDIGNTSDQFHFASEHLAGDGSLVARVTSVENTDPWARAGLMFRDSTDPSAVFADVMATPGNGVTFQWRAAAGAVANSVNVAGITAPVWVELTRVGNSFSAFYSSDGNSWTQLGTAQTVTMNTVAQAGLAVTAHNNVLLNTSTFSNVAVLPSGWTAGDIGGPGLPGSSSYDANSAAWTVDGGGADIWNTADQFRFTNQSFTGDASLTAHVTSLQNSDPWAKAGVMFRDSSDPSASFADVVVSPGNGVAFQWRASAGSQPSNINVTGLSAPLWVRLVRSGSAFSAYYSTDGVIWTQIGTTQTIGMSTTALAGLAVTAHNNALLSTATFDNVSLTTPVDLSSSFNQVGLVSDGAPFSGGGLDGNGSAYSANLLGASPTVDGIPFNLGAAGANNAVQAQGQTVALPAGQASALTFLGTAVNGSQPNQTFTINYTDGTSDTFTVSLSDWLSPQGYTGEEVAAAMGYYDAADGSTAPVPNYLYRYTLPLNRQKTVSSITLPNNANVVLLAIDLIR